LENPKIILFTCNWDAYSGLEAAGRVHRSYPPEVRPIRVPCLGRLHPGIILKAFAQGASGVMMMGCAPEECHYDFGSRKAETAFSQAKALMRLLGFKDSQLTLEYIRAGDGASLVEKISHFVDGLNGNRPSP